MWLITLFLALAAILPLSLTLPTTSTSNPTWLIANFQVKTDFRNRTSLLFHFHDTDPYNKCDLICRSNAAYNGTQVCGGKREVLYKVTKGEVVLRRRTKAGASSMGTARQETNWVDGINRTDTEEGTLFSRDVAWWFPIQSVSG